jgi:hypothetical protein
VKEGTYSTARPEAWDLPSSAGCSPRGRLTGLIGTDPHRTEITAGRHAPFPGSRFTSPHPTPTPRACARFPSTCSPGMFALDQRYADKGRLG